MCWSRAVRESKPKSNPVENFVKTLSNIEILNLIENHLFEKPTSLLDMNKVNETYKEILVENGESPENISTNYKKQLKDLIQENLPEVLFVKSNKRNQPEQLTTSLTQAQAVTLYTETEAHEKDMKSLWKFAKKNSE